MDQVTKVVSFGLISLPTFAYLAYRNPATTFVAFQFNQANIIPYRDGTKPIYNVEKQEDKVYFKNNNLTFTSNLSQALENADVIFLAEPTPTKQVGESAGKAIDISHIEHAVVSIVNYYNKNTQKLTQNLVIVEKSTVPLGTYNMIKKVINSVANEDIINRYVVVSSPELLPEVPSISQLIQPDRILVGCQQKSEKINKFVQLYHFCQNNLLYTSNASSELSRLVATCFLAQRLSSINSIAIFCEQYDADVKEVKTCIGSDTRIGSKFLDSGIGFGGKSMKKDLLTIIYLAECKGLKDVARYWRMVLEMNNYRKRTFFQRIFHELHSNLKGKILAIYGITFKKNTDQIDESPAIDICRDLLVQGAVLHIYDPRASVQSLIDEMKNAKVWKDSYKQRIVECKSAEEAASHAHAIVILTEWPQFKTLNYAELYKQVHKPGLIFDGRNVLDQKMIAKTSFHLCRAGKGFKQHDY